MGWMGLEIDVFSGYCIVRVEVVKLSFGVGGYVSWKLMGYEYSLARACQS